MRYLISYDLDTPGKDYQRLYAALAALGARRVLLSQWVTNRSGTNSIGLRDHLRQFIDASDRILVTSLDVSDWAGFNLMTDPNTA
jgi:hypothetical protein